MRRLTILALLPLLLTACPAPAAIFNAQEDDSEHQQAQYGQFFAIVLGGAGTLVALLVVYGIVKGIRAEHSRGKKKSPFREEILDKTPKNKRPQLLVLGEKVPDWKVDNRLKATNAALKFLACTDKSFSRKRMTAIAADAFLKVKEALEERFPKPVMPLVTKECLDTIISDIRSLREDGKVRVFGRVEVTDVDVVHFEAPVGKKNHTFTALISARSRDYLKDEKSGKVLRGDKKTYVYQEFWQFRRAKDRWLVERIRPSGDMDRVLEAKNVLAEIDLQEFAKESDEAFLREFVGK